MAVIQLEVSDRLIAQIGLDSLYKRMQALIELQELQLIAIEINDQIKLDGFDQDSLLKEAKHSAWLKFKSEQLAEILP